MVNVESVGEIKMKSEMAEKIYDEILVEWVERHGKDNLDSEKLESIRKMLHSMPEDSIYKRVTSMETGKTHMIPIKEIILNGLNGHDLSKYPVIDESQIKE